jgi:hypothetical protein
MDEENIKKKVQDAISVVTHACETWPLKETITNRLMVFERKGLKENI